MGSIMVLPSEILDVQREYPILFRKHPETGQFLPVALLGFEEHENLFLTESAQWGANYIPLALSNGPFRVGVNGEGKEEQLVICINREDPRVNEELGDALFDESGTPSTYLQTVRLNLFRLNEGIDETKKMIDAFVAANLIEALSMEVEFATKEAINFKGAYTIKLENLTQLNAEQITLMNAEGYLAMAYFIAGSLGNVRRLIALKNKTLVAGNS